MTLAASTYDERAVQRILEFCEGHTPWSRRLWQPGTVLIARELLEAADPSMSASDRAMKGLQDDLIARVMFDPAVCVPADRNTTRKLLALPVAGLVKPGHGWHVLNAWSENLRANYLDRWSVALQASNSGLPSAECAARLIAGHLLDEGFSQVYLHRWITYRVKHDAEIHTLASMCQELHQQLSAGSQSVEVLVPLAAHLAFPRPLPDGWLTSQQVRDWRAQNIPDWEPVRQQGAMLLKVQALDVYAAADIARDRVTTIRDRFRVGGGREVVPNDKMWVAGVAAAQPTVSPSRRVEVYAFKRQAALYDHSVRPDIEAAMELMAPLERGPAPAALTGSWAAVEGLLVGPGDESKHVAAERLALILAGAHLRAEFTSLAWVHIRSAGDALADEWRALDSNQQKAQAALAHLASGGQLSLERPHDLNAVERTKAALADPHQYVESIRRMIEPALMGLYRQRNLLSHAGGTAGVGIKPTLERCAPLVAAGMDRIVHVALTRDKSALELSALARVRHEALRGQPATSALALLEI